MQQANHIKLFLEQIEWAVPKSAKAAPTQPPGAWEPASAKFAKTFPALTRLLKAAWLTPVTAGKKQWQFFTWLNGDEFLGWQSPMPSTGHKGLFEEHALMLESFGGIEERAFSDFQDFWVLNHHWVLTAKGAKDDARFILEDEDSFPDGKLPIGDPRDYYWIGLEANGNTTLCHRKTGKVFLFAHDHDFDYVKPVPKCPDYTFYTLNGALKFRSYVDVLAKQWLRRLKLKTT